MSSKSEVEACDRGEAAPPGCRGAIFGDFVFFFFFLDEITVRARKRSSSVASVKMRGNNCSCLTIGVINALITR